MAKDRSRKPSNDSPAELNGELGCSRRIPPCFLGHGAEGDFVTKLIHGKLPNGIWNLSTEFVVSTVHDRLNIRVELAEHR